MSDGQAQPPISRAATGEETGKYCPYCRFPLKERAAVIECGDCQSVHHTECWQDNGGCAVMGCVSAPAAPETSYVPPQGEPPPVLPTGKSAPPPPTGDIPAAAPPAVVENSSRGVLIAAISLGVTALVVIAVATVLSATRGEVNPTVSTSSDAEAASASSELDSASSGSDDTAATEGVLPDDSKSQMSRDMKQTLFEFHDDIVQDDFRGAWRLLSARKRKQALDETGYDGWKTNQASLQPYLDTSGLRMKVISIDEESGVATVNAKGMAWTQSGASCSEWAGVTWLKYERGSWYYDPGYSTTSERKRKWKSRFSELLGGEC